MTKLRIYATIASRIIILLLGFAFLPIIFLIYVLSLLSETYLTSLFSFVASTKELLTQFEKQLNNNK